MRWTCTLALGICLVGCGRSGGDLLDEFGQRWNLVVGRGTYEELYDMLDSASKQTLRRNLENLRSLEAASQQAALDQLDQPRLKDLGQITPRRYFALLWQKATGGQKPQINLNAKGPQTAELILTFDANSILRLPLAIEANRWVWRLPPQSRLLD